MLPAFTIDKSNCKTPDNTTAVRNNSKLPSVLIEERTMAVSPAAGPETLTCDWLKIPTTIPPRIPDTIPEKRGAPLAKAIARQSGRATKKTMSPESKSDFRNLNVDFKTLQKPFYNGFVQGK